jgi:hypothetical protein
MSYTGSLQRHVGSVGIVAPSTLPTPNNVLANAISTAIGLQPLVVAQATQALLQCPNVFDAVYKLDPAQFQGALQNWASGTMGPITAENLCTKLDQFRQDLNQLQAPPAPAPTPPSNAEATGQQAPAQKKITALLWLGGLVLFMGSVVVFWPRK